MKVIEVIYENGGEYTYCHGSWEATINGVSVSWKGEMNTQGEYEAWEFNDEMNVEWHTDRSGLPADKWVKQPPAALTKALKEAGIEPTEDLLLELYPLIQAHDWRHNSCGGCI